MKATEILELLENKVAPVKVSDELCAKYGMYDNSGLIVDMGGEVTGCLFTLELSSLAAERAIALGYNLIVTHHPAIYGGIKRISSAEGGANRAIAMCISHGISIISMHLNFDAAPEGIDHYLMQGLGGKVAADTLDKVEGGAYGRVYDIAPVTLGQLKERAKNVFGSERVLAYGDEDATVSKVASFCGAGSDEAAIAFASSNGAQVFVSSDFRHHLLADLTERGMSVISLTHYCAEAYGFRHIYENIKIQLRVPSSFFFDDRLA